MATVCEVSREALPKKRVRVTYCDPANPGVCYVTAPCAPDNLSVAAAIKAHIARRKAAGQDYVGKPAASPKTYAL